MHSYIDDSFILWQHWSLNASTYRKHYL